MIPDTSHEQAKQSSTCFFLKKEEKKPGETLPREVKDTLTTAFRIRELLSLTMPVSLLTLQHSRITEVLPGGREIDEFRLLWESGTCCLSTPSGGFRWTRWTPYSSVQFRSIPLIVKTVFFLIEPGTVRVLLCFINPILGNRYGPGVIP